MTKKQLLNRKMYKSIKKYDRQEMERFCKSIYSQGFNDGVEDGNNADFKIKLVEILNNTKGVGIKTFDNIMQVAKEMEI